jgi:ABC-type lipoprotein release transport system permease subunit
MILQLAWRNIWRNKTRSIVIMLSVTIGLLTGISVLSLYAGMTKSRVRTLIDTEIAHLQLHHPEFRKDYYPRYLLSLSEKELHDIQSNPKVKSVEPRTVVQGMLATSTGSAGVQINGINPEVEYAFSHLKSKIKVGEGFHPGKRQEIMIGKKLADKMMLMNGAKLVLTFTDSSDNIISAAFRICAIYQSDNTPLDEVNVYVVDSTLNDLLGQSGRYNELAILLKEDEDVNSVQASLKKDYPHLEVAAWNELSPETDLLVKTVDEYSYIIIIIILIALAFGILNTMLMSVLERTREIGMMMALGTSGARIFTMIFLETLILTISGTPFGIFLSWMLINYYSLHGLDFSGYGKEMMSSFGFKTMVYPVFPWAQLTTIIAMVFITAMLSSLLPALKAIRLQPVAAMRK